GIYANEVFYIIVIFFFSSRRRHTRSDRDWSSDVCSSDLDLDNVEFVLVNTEIQGSATKVKTHTSQISPTFAVDATGIRFVNITRSEERRVGKECRYRWWRYH